MARRYDARVANVLVIDDERSMRDFLSVLLEGEGHHVATAHSVASARAACGQEELDLIFSDLRLPDGSGMEVLGWVREHLPDAQVIMMTAYAATEDAVEAMRLGAYDYQMKPFKVEELRALTQKALEKSALLRENRQLTAQLGERFSVRAIIGRSRAMADVVDMIRRVAESRASVLIEGESGTGKELVARAIHSGGARRRGPFVAVNCAAIPESLIEAELFGHAAGAFTGAHRQRAGLFEAADGGTILLDEVSELAPTTQAKLLRVLQERAIRRVGEEQERPVDVRVVSATNRDLAEWSQAGHFREDLYYRLNVVRIQLPPLRERREDIPLLARAFVLKFAAELGKRVEGIAPETLAALEHHGFPGNVRELSNLMERATALARRDVITPEDLPQELLGGLSPRDTPTAELPEAGTDLDATLAAIERRIIAEAMGRCGGVKMRAAELLGVSFRSLRYRMKRLGMVHEE